MSPSLDLNLLETGEKFQQLCFHLIRREYPGAVAFSIGSWDGGRDVVSLNTAGGDVVWQCKMTRRSLSEIMPKVRQSLDALDSGHPIQRWILCLSIDASGKFHDRLAVTLRQYPFIREWEIWDRTVIQRRLDQNLDILEMFFYPVWKSLDQKFRLDELELVSFELEDGCGWQTRDNKILRFEQGAGSDSDLVFDVTVRNRGTICALINRVRLDVKEVTRQLRGVPGAGLLRQQIVYKVSLNSGNPDPRPNKLEPPLEVDAGKHARFGIRLTDTGYAWTAFVRVVVGYSNDKELPLPWMYLVA